MAGFPFVHMCLMALVSAQPPFLVREAWSDSTGASFSEGNVITCTWGVLCRHGFSRSGPDDICESSFECTPADAAVARPPPPNLSLQSFPSPPQELQWDHLNLLKSQYLQQSLVLQFLRPWETQATYQAIQAIPWQMQSRQKVLKLRTLAMLLHLMKFLQQSQRQMAPCLTCLGAALN